MFAVKLYEMAEKGCGRCVLNVPPGVGAKNVEDLTCSPRASGSQKGVYAKGMACSYSKSLPLVGPQKDV